MNMTDNGKIINKDACLYLNFDSNFNSKQARRKSFQPISNFENSLVYCL